MAKENADRSKRIFVIFLVVFIDLLGFGIIIPLLPTFSQNVLNMSETTIGLAAGIFSLMQFVFSPLWGRLSDIYGRKPIIVFSLAGNVLSYIALGLVFSGVFKSVAVLFIARAMAGFFSANIGAAMAYISDITDKKDRSKGMGIIGASFGLGFVFGPFLGGVLAQRFSYGVPVFLSAFLSLVSLILAMIILKESLPYELRKKSGFGNFNIVAGLNKMKHALQHPNVGFLIVLFFIITFSVANIYSTFQLYAESSSGFSFNIEQISYVFAYMGLIGAVVQGWAIRPLVKVFDERKLLIWGNVIMAIGLGAIPFSHHSIPLLLLSLLLLGVGNGLNQPMTLSLVSKFTGPDEQGGILGINQSLSSLARFFGPAWGGLVYERIGFAAPFLTGAIFMIGGTFLSFKLLHDKFNVKN
ncbi:MAG: MFS transporter [Ignavibacteriae bacterium]|nr:MAG: MFS transporter [Ignavibacteriota bacterium]